MAERFSKHLYDFESFLDVQKNLSPRTRAAYVYDIERFSNFMITKHGRMPSPAQITRKHIDAYLEHLQMNRRLKSTTLSRMIASLRVFFEFCMSQGIVKDNPTQFLHNPKIPKKLPIFLTNSELAQLFSAPDRQSPQGKRDYAILATFAFTGMRLSELVGLKIKDVDLSQQTARVLGKGAKERIIPLNEVVVEALNQYLEDRPLSECDALFLNKFKRSLGGRSIENLVKKYVMKAGISNLNISPHKLRHTFATLLHLNEVDLLEIQKLMGHSSITSTQIYTHTNPSKLTSAVKKLENL